MWRRINARGGRCCTTIGNTSTRRRGQGSLAQHFRSATMGSYFFVVLPAAGDIRLPLLLACRTAASRIIFRQPQPPERGQIKIKSVLRPSQATVQGGVWGICHQCTWSEVVSADSRP